MSNTSKQRIQRRRAAAQKKNKLITAVIGVVVIGLGAYAFFSYTAGTSQPVTLNPDRVAPEIGARAPDFMLSDIDGNTVSLSDFRGKPVAVIFFHSW